MSDGRDILGVDWRDIFGGAHLAGKTVLSMFGAGALAAPIEQLESPILPDWAKSGAPGVAQSASASPSASPDHIVTKSDFAVVVYRDSKKPYDVLSPVDATGVYGGRRFEGSGYSTKADFGKKFSFGYDAPARVELVAAGKKITPSDVKQILFCGGVEDNRARTLVSGLYGDSDATATDSFERSRDMGELDNLSDKALDDVKRDRDSGGTEDLSDGWTEVVGSRPVARPGAAGAPVRWSPERVDRVDPHTRVGEMSGRFVYGDDGDDGEPDLGTHQPDYGTGVPDFGVLGARLKDKPAGGVRNPHGYKHGEYVFGDVSGRFVYGDPPNPYLHGVDVLGAGKPGKPPAPRSGFQIKTSPKTGRQFTSLVLNRTAKHDPKRTLVTGQAVAARAQQVSQRGLKAIAAKSKTAARVLGAVSHKVSPGIAALAAQVSKLGDAGKSLGKVVDKYGKVVAAAPAKAAVAATKAKAITKIHGDDQQQILGHAPEWVDIVGGQVVGAEEEFVYEVLGAMIPDAGNPGHYTDGSPIPPGPGDQPDPTNPGFLTPSGAIDPGGAGAGGATASGVPGPPDYGAGAAPTLASVAPTAGVDFMPDPYPNGDDPSFYDAPTDADLPLGAVVFDGSQAPPFMGLGNYSVFFGQLPGSAPPFGGPHSGYQFHQAGDGSDSGWWLVLTGENPKGNYHGDRNFDHVDNFGSWAVAESKKGNNGPLMGNPQGGWTRGLRYSPSGPSGPRWFWFYDTAAAVAPWAVQSLLQARLNDAIVQYKTAVTAGQTDYVNAQLQDKLDAKTASDQAKAQAAQDAQLQMKQQAFDQQAAQQQAQLDAQQAAAAAQQAQQQAQIDAQAQSAQLQYAQQQAQQQGAQQSLDVDTQRAQLSFFQQHPEAMFASVDQGGGGGGGDQGGGDQGDGQEADWGDQGGDSSSLDQIDRGAADVSADELQQDS